MAAAVLPSVKLNNVHTPDRLHMASSLGTEASSSRAGAPSSSRLPPSASQLQPSAPIEGRPTTFSRLRTSLEQTLRTTNKSRGRQSLDETGTITPASQGKGKEKASDEGAATKERSKSSMLSKVPFRRPGGKDSNNSTSSGQASEPVVRNEAAKVERDRDKGKVREAGYTSFQAPSLRQASMSSPTLHLSSQPFPSPYSPFALPAASSSNVATLVSPPRAKKINAQQLTISTKDISGPAPLVPKKDGRSPTSQVGAEQRTGRSRPPIPSGPSKERVSLDSLHGSETPTRRARGGARSPDLSPPSPSPRSAHLAQTASRRAAASATHLPLTTPASPTTARPLSPSHARSSSRTPTTRGHPSASTSHLPLSSPSTPTPPARRSSDTQRVNFSPSPTPARAASPSSTPIRQRAVSPTQRNYSQNLAQIRSVNASTVSLSNTAVSEQREIVRNASSLLIKEMLKPPAQSGMDPKEYEEVEVRLRSLARLERVWGKSGSLMANATQLSVNGAGSGGLNAGGEERERRHFGEALRDGYVLCQLVNKLEPGHIPRVDKREDGFVRTSNVTKFLAACSQLGVPREELFHRDDLIESTPDSMARVAQCIIALLRVNEFPAAKGKVIQGGHLQKPAANSPYAAGTLSRAASSTPNLTRSVSPSAVSSQNGRMRISPSGPRLPTLRSDSPGDSDSEGTKTAGELASKRGTSDAEADDVLPKLTPPTPPARSPLRPRRPSVERASIADSTRASIGDSVRVSYADSVVPPSPARQSLASSHMTDTTAMSSLLDFRSRRSSDAQNSKFGTLRTMTTEATSFVPSEKSSLSPTEAKFVTSFLAEEMKRGPLEPPPKMLFGGRERKPSETAVVDLTRVVEESEEGSSSAKAARRTKSPERAVPVPIPPRPKLQLGKGKWPDDFINAFSPGSPTQREHASSLGDDDEPSTSSISVANSRLSTSPPRKVAIIGASRGNESVESLPQFPRRPTHRARHSVDTPGLLPREALLRRDSSPDTSVSPSPRIMLRRSSTKTGAANRNGIYIARAEGEESPATETPVPFPRTVSAEHSTPPQGVHFPPELTKAPSGTSLAEDRPRQPRGRFQSEIDGASSRRKPRPNSYDDAGAKPGRSRFESMVNLGAPSGTTSASDLMRRDGSAVRKTLIVREDGKPSTQFQLGNCIGRGQFGVVYRALNLNTGQTVAVKRIGLAGLKEEEIAQLMREVDLVKSLSHPSIVKYEGMARDDDTLSIVLEYAENGSLGQTLKAYGKLNEKLVATYVVKILEGLHYLHQSDVVHCDLKAANILTTKTGNVKLSDFGVSLNLRAMERDMPDVAGTPNWMAPEVIELKGASPKSDIWSLGCTVIELLTGRPPYGEIANTMTVMFRIVEDDMPPLPDGASDLLVDFLKQCFQKDPEMRPDAEMLCEHEWVKQNWAAGKEIRPQDSIPFLRRVSIDMQKSEVIKYLAKIEMPEPEREATPEIVPGSPLHQRFSNDIESITPREHSFVKTMFAKPVVCRVCHLEVKRSAVLCSHCSLIAHSKCAGNARPMCDILSQLLLYAQYAEGGGPGSPVNASANPLDVFGPLMGPGTPSTPMSDTGMSSRTSIEGSGNASSPPLSSSPPIHPPSAFKALGGAFKRSRSFLNGDSSSQTPPSTTNPPPSQQPPRQLSRKMSILSRRHHPPPPSVTTTSERPSSIASSTASPQNSSLRSGTTTSNSRSRPDPVRRQSTTISIVETDISISDRTDRDRRLSRMTSGSFSATSMSVVNPDDIQSMDFPGDFPGAGNTATTRKRDGAKNDKSGCLVQ